MRTYYVYILSNYTNTVLYIWVTNDLFRRVYEYKKKLINGFSKKYNCTKLVYYEECSAIQDALLRAKQLKKWNRKKKDNLIDKKNSQKINLFQEWK